MKDLLFIYKILLRNVRRFTSGGLRKVSHLPERGLLMKGDQLSSPNRDDFISRNLYVEHGPSLGLGLASASIPGLAGRFVLVEAQEFCFSKPSGWLSAGSHSFL